MIISGMSFPDSISCQKILAHFLALELHAKYMNSVNCVGII
ncbi:hypothetical protein BD31_I1931 [Candidatus Nitrosopumilus salaria BD31]|uniref:Uncharacterized protein n=1 Tax=Candidatus Nitrosopumilus salarius BD31 TaxID=859350 RepID=I3D4C7_9ARCH|nr:hypothetical protein BD31_I1931 [Candidatus Nitrosopumilus salaria BD31]